MSAKTAECRPGSKLTSGRKNRSQGESEGVIENHGQGEEVRSKTRQQYHCPKAMRGGIAKKLCVSEKPRRSGRWGEKKREKDWLKTLGGSGGLDKVKNNMEREGFGGEKKREFIFGVTPCIVGKGQPKGNEVRYEYWGGGERLKRRKKKSVALVQGESEQ